MTDHEEDPVGSDDLLLRDPIARAQVENPHAPVLRGSGLLIPGGNEAANEVDAIVTSSLLSDDRTLDGEGESGVAQNDDDASLDPDDDGSALDLTS